MTLSISGHRSLQRCGGQDETLMPEHECTESRSARIAKIRKHVLRIDEHLEFQREYLASKSPEKVLAKYSHLFG